MVLLVIAASRQLGVAKPYWDERYWAGQTWNYQEKVRGGLRRVISDSVHQKKVYVPFAGSFVLYFPSIPLVRKPSISFPSNPSSLRISSLCSPRSGPRFAGTLVTPCTWIGLLIVLFKFPPAPASGTTMPFSLNCASLITSLGSRTIP